MSMTELKSALEAAGVAISEYTEQAKADEKEEFLENSEKDEEDEEED